MPGTPEKEIDIRVKLGGIDFRNPVFLASGILGTTADLLLEAYRAGAGAVLTKSIGMAAREGNPNPTVFQYPFGLLNSMGLPNPGIDEFEGELRKLQDSEALVIGSIFGSDENEFCELAERMEKFGARAVELNLSCPHVSGHGAELGSNPEIVGRITSAVVAKVDIPVFVKLTPNTSDIVKLGMAAESGGAAGVVAINSVRAMSIDTQLRKPSLGNIFGGLSGEAIRPIGVRCVYELSDALKIPVIGVGGIASGIDAAEYFMAGASAVQVGTVIEQKGLSVFSDICSGLAEFMFREGFSSLDEMRGIAHE